MKKPLGSIISGSLTDGFVMRINPDIPLEEIKTGKFVSVVGAEYAFFSLVTDISLEVTHSDILLFPPTDSEPLLRNTLKQRDIYATAQLKPMLMLNKRHEKFPVKTIPPHFAMVNEATNQDVAHIFGNEHDESKRYFNIGTPLDMTTPVCLDLERLTERSNGIFGKTGTGKTFLTRLVLAGLIKQDKGAVVIFDMHSEYGLQARKEGSNSFVKGLKTLFPDTVALFSLDPESTRRRGGAADVEIKIPYQAVSVEDILSLQDELHLHATALEAGYLIAAKYKHEWLNVLLQQGERLKDFAQDIGAHPESIAALYRKLKRIERLPFFTSASQGAYKDNSVIDQMMEYIDRGINIIIEFGNFTSTFCYLLISNIIARRIHARYIEKTEQFLGAPHTQSEPKKLMICIEEAHKFLNPQAARQTIFGIIAREMRKYYVSLLVIDQRPSGIDPEIVSQIGTKIVAQLSDDKDIAALLSGIQNAQSLRSILASLDSKKQIMLLGHAVAMPVVVQTREYDQEFYRAMGTTLTKKEIDTLIDQVF